MATTEATTAPSTDVNALTSATKNLSVTEGHKVFAGNLAFSITEEDLRQAFGAAGTVTAVQIIAHGTRSLGYGFVTYATLPEAEKAVTLLDKKEVAGRPINVQIAKPAPVYDSAEKSKRAAKPRNARTRKVRGDGEVDGETTGETKEKPLKRVAKAVKAAITGEPKAPRAPREPREPRERTGTPSETMLFVHNLPFRATDEQLKAVFEGFNPTTAHVARRRRVGRPGFQSKGFGFVDFATHEDQVRALAECQGKTLEDRELSLKVAIQEEKAKAEAEEKAGEVSATLGDTTAGAQSHQATQPITSTA